jgi:hypothetical protein
MTACQLASQQQAMIGPLMLNRWAAEFRTRAIAKRTPEAAIRRPPETSSPQSDLTLDHDFRFQSLAVYFCVDGQ